MRLPASPSSLSLYLRFSVSLSRCLCAASLPLFPYLLAHLTFCRVGSPRPVFRAFFSARSGSCGVSRRGNCLVLKMPGKQTAFADGARQPGGRFWPWAGTGIPADVDTRISGATKTVWGRVKTLCSRHTDDDRGWGEGNGPQRRPDSGTAWSCWVGVERRQEPGVRAPVG